MSLFDHQKCHALCCAWVHRPVRYPYVFGVQSLGDEDRLVSIKIIQGQQEHRAVCLENWVKPERWQERLDRGEAVRCLKRLVSICKADLGLGIKKEGAFGGGGGLQAFFSSVHFSSVPQSCPTLCNSMDCSTPGLPVHHQLPKFLLSWQ